MKETRCAQTAFISDPFSAAHKRLRPQRPKVKSNGKATGSDVNLTLESQLHRWLSSSNIYQKWQEYHQKH
jgi:hypothetical protein